MRCGAPCLESLHIMVVLTIAMKILFNTLFGIPDLSPVKKMWKTYTSRQKYCY